MEQVKQMAPSGGEQNTRLERGRLVGFVVLKGGENREAYCLNIYCTQNPHPLLFYDKSTQL